MLVDTGLWKHSLHCAKVGLCDAATYQRDAANAKRKGVTDDCADYYDNDRFNNVEYGDTCCDNVCAMSCYESSLL